MPKNAAQCTPPKTLAEKTRLIGLTILILFAVAVVYFILTLGTAINDGYAELTGANLIILYVRDNDSWPNDWSDLQPYYEGEAPKMGGWPFAKFQSRLFIDFSANLEDLRWQSKEQESAEFDVIHARRLFPATMDKGPNEKLRRFLANSY